MERISTNRILPLTQHMIELLMDCHEKELMQQEPCDVGSTHHAGGLLARGLLEVKRYITPKGKQIMALFVTDLGREYLSKL